MRKIINFLCIVVITVFITVLIMNNNAKADGNGRWNGPSDCRIGDGLEYTYIFDRPVGSCQFSVHVDSQASSGSVNGLEMSSRSNVMPGDEPISSIKFRCTAASAGTVKLILESENGYTYEDGTYGTTILPFTLTITDGDVPPPITEINIGVNGQNSVQLEVGQTARATSDVEGVSWLSSNPEVAAIDQDGNIRAMSASENSVIITASKDGITSNGIEVSVIETPTPPPPVEGETPVLTPTSIELTVDEQCNIQVVNSDQVAVDWSISGSSEMMIVSFVNADDSKCEIKALSVGETTITATSKTDSSKSASVSVKVNPKHGEVIDTEPPVISPSSNVKISVGTQKTLSANKGVVWKSSDSSVVSVGESSGIIKGVSEGKATITAIALSNNQIATVDVEVVPKQNDGGDGIDSADPVITPSGDQTIKIGGTLKLSADKAVTWSSGNKAIATVDSNGNVKGIKAGTTEISATTSDGRFSTVKVTVNADGSSSKGNTTTDTTGSATVDGGNSSSTVNEAVPKTGEASTTTLIVIGVITLVIATVIFRRKAK